MFYDIDSRSTLHYMGCAVRRARKAAKKNVEVSAEYLKKNAPRPSDVNHHTKTPLGNNIDDWQQKYRRKNHWLSASMIDT